MVTEVGRLPYRWPADTDFALLELDVLDRDCPACGRLMYICDHRYRRFHTLDGPVEQGQRISNMLYRQDLCQVVCVEHAGHHLSTETVFVGMTL